MASAPLIRTDPTDAVSFVFHPRPPSAVGGGAAAGSSGGVGGGGGGGHDLRDARATVRVRNISPHPVAFKVRTTKVSLYYVRPNQGVIDAGGVAHVNVTMQQEQGPTIEQLLEQCDLQEDESTEDPAITGKFMLQATLLDGPLFDTLRALPPEQQGTELSLLWLRKDPAPLLFYKKLKSRFTRAGLGGRSSLDSSPRTPHTPHTPHTPGGSESGGGGGGTGADGGSEGDWYGAAANENNDSDDGSEESRESDDAQMMPKLGGGGGGGSGGSGSGGSGGGSGSGGSGGGGGGGGGSTTPTHRHTRSSSGAGAPGSSGRRRVSATAGACRKTSAGTIPACAARCRRRRRRRRHREAARFRCSRARCRRWPGARRQAPPWRRVLLQPGEPAVHAATRPSCACGNCRAPGGAWPNKAKKLQPLLKLKLSLNNLTYKISIRLHYILF